MMARHIRDTKRLDALTARLQEVIEASGCNYSEVYAALHRVGDIYKEKRLTLLNSMDFCEIAKQEIEPFRSSSIK